MESIVQKRVESQEEKKLQKVEGYIQSIEPEKFWEELGAVIREGIRIALEKAINYEFSQFIGALEYERTPNRRDVRNGYRTRNFETVYGPLEDIKIPRARNSSFTSRIVPRFKRRQGRKLVLSPGYSSLAFLQGTLRKCPNTSTGKPTPQALYQGSTRSWEKL